MSRAFLLTIPHSGEQIPPEASWLRGLPEEILMRDVDRYVDRLYAPGIAELGPRNIIAPWHRYAGDLNRYPEDVDEASVLGHSNPRGSHPRGFHWSVTTQGEILMKEPMTMENHRLLVQRIYEPFHHEVERVAKELKEVHEVVYHIDAHSMPSAGTSMHPDPGETRAQVVISDQEGKSCSKAFLELVVEAYSGAGFEVKLNWPYVGGRITQRYGRPDEGRHTIQVELNRSLYMNEETKKLLPEHTEVQHKLTGALREILGGIEQLKPFS